MVNFDNMDLKCIDCGADFVWTANEQQFYAEREFSQPRRCVTCRKAKKAQRQGGGEKWNY